MDIRGKTAFITGAASGLGLGIARTFARAGANIALTDIESGPLSKAYDDVGVLGVRALAIETDVTDADAVAAAVERTETDLGPIDILVNNAGVETSGADIDETPMETVDWLIDVNIRGVIHGLQAALPRMRERGKGYVVNVASIGGLQVNPDVQLGTYSMTKYAVVALTESLHDSLAADGITISAYCPGAINSNIWNSSRNRPDKYGGAAQGTQDHPFWQLLKNHGLSPDDAGRFLLAAMKDGPLFIVTDERMRHVFDRRHAAILDAYDRAETIRNELGLAPMPPANTGAGN